jgi:hypothetical protein
MSLEIQSSKATKECCRGCGKGLGYYVDKKTNRTFKRFYFSSTPFKMDDKEYYRDLCIDCFFETNGRLPKSPNVTNLDYLELMSNLPVERFKELMKNTYGITLHKLTLKFGKEEGEKRWNSYCQKQSETNTFEYKNKKYGMSKQEFDAYNKSRAVTRENLISKHGFEEGEKRWKSYCEKQSFAGCKEEYFVEKYGKERGEKVYRELNKKKALTLENFVLKYGEEEGIIRFQKYINRQASSVSKVSQKFFWEIYNKIPPVLQKKTYFKELNSEFGTIVFENHVKTNFYKYDFVISSIGFVLEYNGDLFHANPKMFLPEDTPNFFDKKITAKEIWEKDKIKKDYIENERGYHLYYVWDSEVLQQPERNLENVLNLIRNHANEHNITF